MDAKTVLNQHWDGALPVDVLSIATRMGINVVDADPMDGVAGFIKRGENDSSQIICAINRSDAITRQRFTLAHEIGHFALGHLSDGRTQFRDTLKQFSNTDGDYRETDANNFAARLLMPAHVVNWLIKDKGFKTIESLAQKFNVSNQAMTYRLNSLGWLNGN